ncbi:MAG: 3-deoxy-8-phosphooctulonate synthase [Cognatishimia sp.]|uniref:3-deoxy-8-phosphooctulonate synthase n=1 Tax=Cognatishimia sp. TaxID=2211648 RepID=UPI003B8D8AB9
MEQNIVNVGDIAFGGQNPISFIAGPCQLEGRDHALMMAEKVAEAMAPTGSKFIFKSSYDKANRSSIGSSRGIGMDEGLKILEEVRNTFGCPVITDVHETTHCPAVAEVVDIIQIPAFLCRQTDLLLAAGNTGKPLNVKKGQFLAPWEMANVAEKIKTTGNEQIMLCERGTSFGYNTLVNDFRGLPTMSETGCPVIFDATHSVQQPGGRGNSSGGERKFVATVARAAVAVGVAGLFIETHQDPDMAPCDGPNMIPVDKLATLIGQLVELDQLTKAHNA